MEKTHSVDDILINAMQNQTPESAPLQAVPVTQELPKESVPPSQEASPEAKPEEKSEVPHETLKEPEKVESNQIDEYGNPIKKPKMYSEDELQKIVQDRISRVKHRGETSPQQQPQQATTQPNTDEEWAKQLEEFVERTIDKRQEKVNRRHWEEMETRKQANFESKFTQGMNKYDDFYDVVADKPLTDAMMLAVRNLENPAAFVYGAAKLHAPELERISKIADPYQQATEVGRLHEKMVRNRNVISKSDKPLDPPKSDMPSKVDNMPSLEQRIMDYARQKRR